MGKTSSVWKYFTKRRDGFANCNLCGKKLKTSGNTTNLLGHVSRMHKNHVAEDVKTAEEVNQNKSTNNEIEPESNQGATSADTNNNMSNPLEVLTKEVSADKYVTISKIIPMVHCLKSELDNQQTDSPEVINLKQSLSSEIHKRFGKMEHVETLAISTLLDPRFKKLHFKDYVAVGNSILVIKRKLEKLFAVDNVDNQMESSPIEEEIEKEMDLWKLHKTMVAEHQNKGTSEDDIKNIINAEVSQYINSPVYPLKSDPLLIWEAMKITYPHLHKLALKYLQICATSVPAERLFSKTGQIVTAKRSRLKPQRLNKLVFLSSIDNN
ncbi:E3 SUMO-protein ligase ZBED1-like isoform X2 [Tenebrio molitor]|uniref:E3 SUMO-protein ligase ZBED1-like isoform X2 n=1 Tax=Tenebrio molitor TaxID=7067 RepID=UPI0036247E43